MKLLTFVFVERILRDSSVISHTSCIIPCHMETDWWWGWSAKIIFLAFKYSGPKATLCSILSNVGQFYTNRTFFRTRLAKFNSGKSTWLCGHHCRDVLRQTFCKRQEKRICRSHAQSYSWIVCRKGAWRWCRNPRERGLPNVVRTIDVSCTTGHQISQLREIIYNTALEIKGHGRKYENASEVVGSG